MMENGIESRRDLTETDAKRSTTSKLTQRTTKHDQHCKSIASHWHSRSHSHSHLLCSSIPVHLFRFGFPPFSPSPRVCVIRCVLRSVCLCLVFFSPPPLECTIDHPRALRIADSAECCGLPVALSSRPAAAVSSQPDRQCCDTPSVSDSHGAHDSRKI
jgi:hypothetical protein